MDMGLHKKINLTSYFMTRNIRKHERLTNNFILLIKYCYEYNTFS